MQVKALQSDPEIARVIPVLLQLRPQYDEREGLSISSFHFETALADDQSD
ncbi:MAG: hypothetical protein WD396_07425 [Pseudohongiellaceae bacterium]